METLVEKLCQAHPSPEKQPSGKTATRWSCVLQDYINIRKKIVNNAIIMDHTQIQLLELNSFTISKWHNNKSKEADCKMLLQGSRLTDPPMAANRSLPATISSSSILPEVLPETQHQFVFPDNTARTVTGKINRESTSQDLPISVEGPLLSEPHDWQFYRNLKLQKDATMAKSPKRGPYKPRTPVSTCAANVTSLGVVITINIEEHGTVRLLPHKHWRSGEQK